MTAGEGTSSSPVCIVVNRSDNDLDIYSFTVPKLASASDPNSLYPNYTKVGSAPKNATTR
jgi:hypothetical protein